jgi:hypothetical protein
MNTTTAPGASATRLAEWIDPSDVSIDAEQSMSGCLYLASGPEKSWTIVALAFGESPRAACRQSK